MSGATYAISVGGLSDWGNKKSLLLRGSKMAVHHNPSLPHLLEDALGRLDGNIGMGSEIWRKGNIDIKGKSK